MLFPPCELAKKIDTSPWAKQISAHLLTTGQTLKFRHGSEVPDRKIRPKTRRSSPAIAHNLYRPRGDNATAIPFLSRCLGG